MDVPPTLSIRAREVAVKYDFCYTSFVGVIEAASWSFVGVTGYGKVQAKAQRLGGREASGTRFDDVAR